MRKEEVTAPFKVLLMQLKEMMSESQDFKLIFLNIVSSKCCLPVPTFSPQSPPALPNFDVTFHPSFARAYAALQSLFRDVCSLVWGVPHTLVLCCALGIGSPSGSTLDSENVGWVLSGQRPPLPVAPLSAS